MPAAAKSVTITGQYDRTAKQGAYKRKESAH